MGLFSDIRNLKTLAEQQADEIDELMERVRELELAQRRHNAEKGGEVVDPAGDILFSRPTGVFDHERGWVPALGSELVVGDVQYENLDGRRVCIRYSPDHVYGLLYGVIKESPDEGKRQYGVLLDNYDAIRYFSRAEFYVLGRTQNKEEPGSN